MSSALLRHVHVQAACWELCGVHGYMGAGWRIGAAMGRHVTCQHSNCVVFGAHKSWHSAPQRAPANPDLQNPYMHNKTRKRHITIPVASNVCIGKHLQQKQRSMNRSTKQSPISCIGKHIAEQGHGTLTGVHARPAQKHLQTCPPLAFGCSTACPSCCEVSPKSRASQKEIQNGNPGRRNTHETVQSHMDRAGRTEIQRIRCES